MKLTLNDLDSTKASSIISTINENNALIEEAIEKTLSRDGTSPNSLEATLDANSNRIINLPVAQSPTEPMRKAEFDLAISDGAAAAIMAAHVAAADPHPDYLRESTIINEARNTVDVGDNVRPDRYYNPAAPLIKGEYVLTIGTDILLPTNALASVSTFMGPWCAWNAGSTGLYGVDFVGFRTAENMTDGQYVQGFGIDAFKTATYARNSAAFGAKAGLYKTDVQGVTAVGVSSAYAPGVISNSVLIGAQAADGFASSTNVYSFTAATIVGVFAGRGNEALGNTFFGANIASATDITGPQNVAVGRASLFNLASGALNVAIGDSSGSQIAAQNFVTIIGASSVVTTAPGSGGIYIGSQVEPSSAGIVDEINIGGVIYGIRTAGSQVLRVNGHFRKATASLPLVNGLNSNVTCPNADVLRISGAITGVFSLGGLTGGVAGRVVHIFSPFGYDFTIVADDAASAPANRIRCRGSTSRTLTGGLQMATLVHTGTEWVLAATNQSP